MPEIKKRIRALTKEELAVRNGELSARHRERVANTIIVEVRTVEKVERLYTVSVDKRDVASLHKTTADEIDDMQVETFARDVVLSGEQSNFTEGNAEIEDSESKIRVDR